MCLYLAFLQPHVALEPCQTGSGKTYSLVVGVAWGCRQPPGEAQVLPRIPRKSGPWASGPVDTLPSEVRTRSCRSENRIRKQDRETVGIRLDKRKTLFRTLLQICIAHFRINLHDGMKRFIGKRSEIIGN